MLPETRTLAIAQKSKLYRTGKPCTNGHISNRYTKSGACISCIADAVRRHRDQEELRYRGFMRKSYLVHRDDVTALDSVVELFMKERLSK